VITDVARGKSLSLGLEIDLCVDVGGVERHVPQPAADRVDVNAGAASDGIQIDAQGEERPKRELLAISS